MKFDKEKYLNNALVKAIARDMPEVEREADQFRQHFAEFLARDGGEIGKVLTRHLAIEFYLAKFLRAAHPHLGISIACRFIKNWRRQTAQKYSR